MVYVVDTHVLVWYLEGSDKLSPKLTSILEHENNRLVIPTIVLAEVKYLSFRNRINLSMDELLLHIESDPRCIVYPLDSNVVEFLPVSVNIHDAIICATALVYENRLGQRAKIITKDEEITSSGIVETVWE